MSAISAHGQHHGVVQIDFHSDRAVPLTIDRSDMSSPARPTPMRRVDSPYAEQGLTDPVLSGAYVFRKRWRRCCL